MTTYTIRFYEGSNQYRSTEVLAPSTSSKLYTGILEELNHQYYCRATKESLWATVIMDGAELYRVSRLTEGLVQVREASSFDEPYKFIPLEAFSLTQLMFI